jgi:hypothetical protein
MDISTESLEILLKDAMTRDRTTARRISLLKILLKERYMTREQLIIRVEGMLGKGCFGESVWIDTFYRDMRVVKSALVAAGNQLAYSRSQHQPGYYLRNQPATSSDLSSTLESSINEVNSAQISVLKQMTIQQRFQQGLSVSNLACKVVANRYRQNNPKVSFPEAHRQVIQKAYDLE